VARWLDRFGFDATVRWCEFNNQAPDITIRPRDPAQRDAIVRALHESGIDASACRFVADALQLSPGMLGHLPREVRDQVIVQEEASQIVAHAVGARAGDRILDLCAAPGGKTTIVSAALGDAGLLVASDFRPSRVRLLASSLRTAHIRASIVRLDATRPLPFAAAFDRILIDAPCSGLGTLRLNPDLKWSRRPGDLPAFASDQVAMLDATAAAIVSTGALVYATCSSEPEENEHVVDAFLAATDAFSRVDARTIARVPADVVDARGWLRTLPHRHGLEAFFGAVLERSEGADAV